MFGQYTVESRVKRNKKHRGVETYVIPRAKMTPEEINDLVRKNVRDLVLLGGAVYVAKRLADAAYQISIVVAEVKLNG